MGHAIYCEVRMHVWKEGGKRVKSDWRYTDTNERIDDVPPRSCLKCGMNQTADGHDPCIANLPGVEHACCGHGVDEGYIKFENGTVLRGTFDHMRKKQCGTRLRVGQQKQK